MTEDEKIAELDSVGIHNLRNIARSWGVKTPTSKRKNQLLSELRELMRGGKAPVYIAEPKKSVLKHLAVASPAINELLPPTLIPFVDKFAKKQTRQYLESVANYANLHDSLFKNEDFQKEESSGYVVINENLYLFINEVGKLVFIPNILAEKHNLKEGDFVRVRCAMLENEKTIITGKILQVNPGYSLTTDNIYDFSKPVASRGTIIDGIEIAHRNFVNVVPLTRDFSHVEEIINKFGNKYEVLVLGVGLSVDQHIALSKIENIQLFASLFEEDPYNSMFVIQGLINRVKLLATNGKKVIVYVVNLDKVIIEMNSHEVHNQAMFEVMASRPNILTRQLLSLHRTLKNGATVTLIVGYDREEATLYAK